LEFFPKPICNFSSIRNLGAFAAKAANRAFRSKSSDLLMQILRAFRYNPWRAPSGSAKSLRDFATSQDA
jgi:hypothetical protein